MLLALLPAAAAAALATGAGPHRVAAGKDLFALLAPAAARGARPQAAPPVQIATPTQSYEVEVTDAGTDDDGAYVAARGHVRGTAPMEVDEEEGSAFMMKGTAQDLTGWLIVDGNTAYEYFTGEDGVVAVAAVPVSHVKTTCDFGDDHDAAGRGAAPQEEYPTPHVGAYNGEDIRKLQSLPGARKVLLLDIDTYFVDKARGDAVRKWSKEYFFQNWQAVAAGFSMFELNVVTDTEAYQAASLRNRGKSCYIDDTRQSSAFVNSFGSNGCGSRNYNHYGRATTGYRLGRVSLHEAGHMFGLYHDGNVFEDRSRREYSRGIAAYKWGSIMGGQWQASRWGDDQVLQWSKGDYRDANNQQDDLQVIGRHLPRRSDDIAAPRALWIAPGGRVAAAHNSAQITSGGDSDPWTFAIGAGGGRVDLVIDRNEFLGGSMLDVDATLVEDATGRVVQHSNVRAARRAVIRAPLAAGAYTLTVRGGAEGTPESGFSNYGSLGGYAIVGTVVGVAAGGTEAGPRPTPPPRTPLPPSPPGTWYPVWGPQLCKNVGKPAWEEDVYQTQEDCCRARFGHNLAKCLAWGGGKAPQTPAPTPRPAAPTAIPPTPVPATVAPTAMPPTPAPATATPPTPQPQTPRPASPTAEPDTPQTPTPATPKPPAPAPEGEWYPAWRAGVCQDSGKPSWQKATFTTQAACCGAHFRHKLKACMAWGVGAPDTTPAPAAVTPSPPVRTAAPATLQPPTPQPSEPTDAPPLPSTPAPPGGDVFWPAWASRACKGGAAAPAGKPKHASKAACCRAHFDHRFEGCMAWGKKN